MFDSVKIISVLAGLGAVSWVRFWLMPRLNLIPASDTDILANAAMILVILAGFIVPFLATRALLTALYG